MFWLKKATQLPPQSHLTAPWPRFAAVPAESSMRAGALPLRLTNMVSLVLFIASLVLYLEHWVCRAGPISMFSVCIAPGTLGPWSRTRAPRLYLKTHNNKIKYQSSSTRTPAGFDGGFMAWELRGKLWDLVSQDEVWPCAEPE